MSHENSGLTCRCGRAITERDYIGMTTHTYSRLSDLTQIGHNIFAFSSEAERIPAEVYIVHYRCSHCRRVGKAYSPERPDGTGSA